MPKTPVDGAVRRVCMLVSEIEYHIVLIPWIEDITPAMKKNLKEIVPDTVAQFKGRLLKMEVDEERLYLQISAPPDISPADIAGTIISEVSARMKRVHPELKGYGEIFREDYYVKTGSRPGKVQIDDFISIAKHRI
jgi:REP element-mobilizing transposase RayT